MPPLLRAQVKSISFSIVRVRVSLTLSHGQRISSPPYTTATAISSLTQLSLSLIAPYWTTNYKTPFISLNMLMAWSAKSIVKKVTAQNLSSLPKHWSTPSRLLSLLFKPSRLYSKRLRTQVCLSRAATPSSPMKHIPHRQALPHASSKKCWSQAI